MLAKTYSMRSLTRSWKRSRSSWIRLREFLDGRILMTKYRKKPDIFEQTYEKVVEDE